MRRSALALLLLLALPAGAAAEFDPAAEVRRSETTGKVRFVGMPAGRADAGPGRSTPAAAGRAYLEDNARAFGLEHSSVRVAGRERAPKGGSTVRYQQAIDGVDVLGGQFAVTLTENNRVRSVLGEALPDAEVATDPAVAAGEARRQAIAAGAKAHQVSAVRLTASEPVLRVFDPRLMGGPVVGGPYLVWETTVESDDGRVKELVFVDARRPGVIVERIGLIHEAKNRSVCDAGNSATQIPCTAPVLTEGGTYGGGVSDVQFAYDYAGATYDFFFSEFGRDSLDGQGMALKSTVRYCEPGFACPYQNAFWNGEQMGYGQGFAAADDVVGHELAHGVTDFTSSLYYYYQSGAINESLSDVFGELVDLRTASANDAASDRWLLGETLGAIRNMKDPTAMGDPDRMGSPLFHKAETDSGGVHINSGVGNKAAYLITDGDTFNGQTVSGIGITKAAAIYYEVETGFLNTASDYFDLGNALTQACANLVGSKGITSADCEQVAKAVAATEMLTNDGGATDMPTCPPGVASRYSWFDDLESGLDAWTARPIVGTNGWFFNDGVYATSGNISFFGANSGTRRDGAVEMLDATAIRPDSRLVFRHAYGFEDSDPTGTNRYDGGVVEQSTDGGATWTDVPGMPYTGTISTGFDNPLMGRNAFTNESMGYITTVVPLPALANRSARFRWRLAEDSGGGGRGWFIDDIGVIVCDGAPPDTSITSGPAAGETLPSGSSPSFAFTTEDTEKAFECRTDGGGFAPCASGMTLTGLAAGPHTFEVRAKDWVGNVDPTPASRSFAIASPTTTAPPPPTTTQPPQPPTTNVVTPPGSFRLLGRPKVKGTRVTFTFALPAAGTVRISGSVKVGRRTLKVGSKRLTATTAGQRTLTVQLTKTAVRHLRRRTLKPRFTATFTPRAAGAAQTLRRTVTFKRTRR